MKKMGRLLALLTVLSLLVSIFPAALAETHSFRDDIPTIDTVPTTITLPSEFELCKYFFVDDIYLQKAKFTAPETGTYYFYERREDNVKPMIQVYTQENDDIPAGMATGESGKELILEVYLKKGYTYLINFSFVLQDTTNTQKEGIFIASCRPSQHMEQGTTWTVATQPANGQHGTRVCYCDFCHQVGWRQVIPAIPWKLRIINLSYHSAKIRWSASKDATKYEVYVRKYSTSASAKLVGTVSKKKTSFTLTGLTMGKTYYVQVKAQTPYGTSDYSEMLTVQPTLQAPVSFKGESPISKTVVLTWRKRANAQGYIIYVSNAPNGPYQKAKVVNGGNKTEATLEATPRATFYYKIAAYRVIKNKKIPGILSPYVQVTVKK